MSIHGDKQYIETERIVVIWKLCWIIKIGNKNKQKEMVFEDKYDAYNLMCLQLKRKKCAWIERHEVKQKFRVYATGSSK